MTKEIRTFKPLHDNVLIRRKERDDKTSGGILLPDKSKDKPVEGEVLAVGPGVRGEMGGSEVVPLSVEVGDNVLFSMHAGTYVRVTGEELVTMQESDILGIVE